jgi:AcrR family transcriptional regulator
MTQTAPPTPTPTPLGPEEQGLIEAVTEPGPGVDIDEPAESATTETAETETAETESAPTTRDRILDVALELFTTQGFDGTSLREIAERLDITKAALYYHFESKEDILLALHMRLHEFGRDALMRMQDEEVTLELWGELLDAIVDKILIQRPLFLMHERNQAALEKLHRKEHDAEHEDIQNQFRRVLADTDIPLEDRVRMAASFGVLFSSLFLTGEAFSTASNEELGRLLRSVLRDVLGG